MNHTSHQTKPNSCKKLKAVGQAVPPPNATTNRRGRIPFNQKVVICSCWLPQKNVSLLKYPHINDYSELGACLGFELILCDHNGF